jgi:TM2 domain-containing membrane protein YozV
LQWRLHTSEPQAGANVERNRANGQNRILPAALLCFFFGVFGVRRFYVGKIGTGFLELVTFGGFGMW